MANPNIVNVTAIYGKTAPLLVTTTATAIVSNAAASGKVVKANALYVTNVNASTTYTVTVDFYRSSTAYRFSNTVSIPPGSALDLLSKSLYLEEGDSIRLTASANSVMEAVCSYEEIN